MVSLKLCCGSEILVFYVIGLVLLIVAADVVDSQKGERRQEDKRSQMLSLLVLVDRGYDVNICEDFKRGDTKSSFFERVIIIGTD